MTKEIDHNAIWEKAILVEGYDPDLIRKDCCGAWILKDEYANRDSRFGWEVDHIFPESLGGGNDSDNLRPMQWENNVSKGNDYPNYIAAVKAEGGENVDFEAQFSVNETTQKIIKKLYQI